MSFTFTRKMPAYHYRGNDAYLKLTNSSGDVFTSGTEEVISITVTPASTAVADTITIKLEDGDVVFTCVAALTGAEGEYLPRSSFGSDAAFMAALAVRFNAHYDLYQVFTASVSGSILDLFSKQYGNFTLSPYAVITGTGYSFSHTAGALESVINNFRHRVAVYRTESTNELTKLGEEYRLPVINGGNAESLFNIKDYIAKLQNNYFKWSATTEVVNRSSIIETFTAYAGETVNNYGEANLFKVIPGKLRNEYFERFYVGSSDGSVSSDWDTSVWFKFLTNCTTGKLVPVTGHEKLYFLAKLRTCTVAVNFYAADGTTSLHSYNSHSFTDLELVELHFDIAEMLTHYATPANVCFIKVVVHETGGSDISEEFRYEIDRNYYQTRRTVIFKNQRGGYDVLSCTGDMAVQDEFERQEIALANSVGNPNTLIKRGVFNAVQRSVQSLSTGWVRKADMLWLADLLLSDEIYLIDDDNSNILHHCTITTSEQGRRRDRSHQYAVNFDLVVLEG